MLKSLFNESGYILKGNLHSHSTNSDGRVEPEGLARGYRDKGYDFLSITDHDVYYDNAGYEDGVILVPGFELTAPVSSNRVAHITVLTKDSASDFSNGETFELQSLDDTRAFLERHCENHVFILNHPEWSFLTCADYFNLPHISGIEYFNYASEMGDFLGTARHFSNLLLAASQKLFFTAGDDSHNRDKASPGWPFDSLTRDSFGAWTVVQAQEKTRQGVVEGLLSGHSYISTGPEIKSFYVDDEGFHVECSEAQRISVSAEYGGLKRKIGLKVTEFSGTLKGTEKLLKLLVGDSKGRFAFAVLYL